MSRLLFVLPAMGAGDTVRVDTASGSTTPADITPGGGGPSIPGATLHADRNGQLPRILGPADGTATLYLKQLDYRGTVVGSPVTVTGVDTQGTPPTYAPAVVPITQQAADYTLALTDSGSEVEGTKATAQTITVPPASSVAFPVGTTINVRQYGAGQITIAAGVGVTLRAPNGAKTAKQYATVGLIKRAADEWIVSGDTTT